MNCGTFKMENNSNMFYLKHVFITIHAICLIILTTTAIARGDQIFSKYNVKYLSGGLLSINTGIQIEDCIIG